MQAFDQPMLAELFLVFGVQRMCCQCLCRRYTEIEVRTMPGESSASFDPTLELVVVLETNDRIQTALAKGILEEAGIPFFVLGQITTLVTDVDGFLKKWVRIQVPQDREEEARELLEPLLEATS